MTSMPWRISSASPAAVGPLSGAILKQSTNQRALPSFRNNALAPARTATPNPALNLTRYGKRRKPGLQHAS